MAQKGRLDEWLLSDAITSADTGTTKAVLDIPAKTMVMEVLLIITTVFAGGTPSLDIGDGDNPDGWIDSTDITETTLGSYKGTETNTSAYLDTGRYYLTADTIDAVVSASLTGGNAYVIAHVLKLADDI